MTGRAFPARVDGFLDSGFGLPLLYATTQWLCRCKLPAAGVPSPPNCSYATDFTGQAGAVKPEGWAVGHRSARKLTERNLLDQALKLLSIFTAQRSAHFEGRADEHRSMMELFTMADGTHLLCWDYVAPILQRRLSLECLELLTLFTTAQGRDV